MSLTKLPLSGPGRSMGVSVFGPTKVFAANEEDISTPNTSVQFVTQGIRRVTFQVIVAGYTAPTVKFQRSLDNGTTWADITGATLGASGVVDFAPEAPLIRLSVTGTLSVGADTLDVWVSMEAQPSK